MLNLFRRKPTVTMLSPVCNHGPAPLGCAICGMPPVPDTRFRPGQSGNPLGRPPADPDARNLREARRIAARMYRAMPFTVGGDFTEKRAAAIEAGHRDTAPEVLSVLEGVRCGRALERAAPTLAVPTLEMTDNPCKYRKER